MQEKTSTEHWCSRYCEQHTYWAHLMIHPSGPYNRDPLIVTDPKLAPITEGLDRWINRSLVLMVKTWWGLGGSTLHGLVLIIRWALVLRNGELYLHGIMDIYIFFIPIQYTEPIELWTLFNLQPDIKAIKERIGTLIELEFLARDGDDPKTIVYVS